MPAVRRYALNALCDPDGVLIVDGEPEKRMIQ
jgi:hypothetical protein